MKEMQISFFLIITFLITITYQKDPSTFSNYDIIQQSKIEVNFNVDFTNKIVTGKEKIYFKALEEGEVIALDTKALIINSIIDSDTGDYLEYKIDNYYKLESLGIPLKIYKEYQKDDDFSIVISFSTTEDGMALDWLNPEQTSGKKYPFMYSQGQAILCRDFIPIQDTPAVKMPISVSITVPKPLLGLVGGIYQKEKDKIFDTIQATNEIEYSSLILMLITKYIHNITEKHISIDDESMNFLNQIDELCTEKATLATIDGALVELNKDSYTIQDFNDAYKAHRDSINYEKLIEEHNKIFSDDNEKSNKKKK